MPFYTIITDDTKDVRVIYQTLVVCETLVEAQKVMQWAAARKYKARIRRTPPPRGRASNRFTPVQFADWQKNLGSPSQ